MGLTIHYQLQTPKIEIEDIRCLAEAFRQFAKDLPFTEVGDLVEFEGKDADFENALKDDEYRWLKIQAGQFVNDGDRMLRVAATHLIGFSTWPGEGCEEANFGFCQYPAFVPCPTRSGPKRRYSTHLNGWQWGSFCKTQYASDPKCGGVQNFLRCHLCVIKLLDFAKSTGQISVEVKDEGGYWEERNLQKLANEVGDWNAMIAAHAGIFKDALNSQGITLESAITGFQDFEHLEARGLARLKNLQSKRRKDNP
jgi:hypothetical protein